MEDKTVKYYGKRSKEWMDNALGVEDGDICSVGDFDYQYINHEWKPMDYDSTKPNTSIRDIIELEHNWAMQELKKEYKTCSRQQSMQMPIFTAGFFIGIVIHYILEISI